MQATVSTKDLTAVFKRMGALGKGQTMPILSCVHLEAREGALICSATDLETYYRETLPAQVGRPGVATIPRAQLQKLLAKAEERVTLSVAIEGQVELFDGETRYTLTSYSPDEYPALDRFLAPEQARWTRVTPAEFLAALDAVEYAASTDDTRYHLNTIALEHMENGTLRAVATDGHRLAMIDTEIDAGFIPGSAAQSDDADKPKRLALLPAQALPYARALLRMECETSITVHEPGADAFISIRAGTRAGTATLSVRTVAQRYPDYRAVLGTSAHNCTTEVDARSLLRAIDKLSPILGGAKSSAGIQCMVNGAFDVFASHDGSSGRQSLPCTHTGPQTRIGIDPTYLREAVESAGTDRVTICAQGEGTPDGDGYLGTIAPVWVLAKGRPQLVALVMPMRV